MQMCDYEQRAMIIAVADHTNNYHSMSSTSILDALQVLEDVIEYEITAEGTRETHLEQILLNGNNIALLVSEHSCKLSSFPACQRCEPTTHVPPGAESSFDNGSIWSAGSRWEARGSLNRTDQLPMVWLRHHWSRFLPTDVTVSAHTQALQCILMQCGLSSVEPLFEQRCCGVSVM